MKKTMAFVLALCLLLSLGTPVVSMAEEEKTVVTMGGLTSLTDWLNFDSYQKLQNDLGITIEYTYYNSDSFNAMLAGGDLPDLVLCSNRLDTVLGSNLALDLSPYLDQLPNLQCDLYKSTLELTRELWGGENNGIYVLCPVVGQHCWNGGNYMTERGYTVCWEYYKELGCPTIENDDDYIDVLVQMQANHPTTEDGSPTYLFGVYGGLSGIGGFRASFRSDIAVNAWSGTLYRGSTYDNHLVNGFTDVENSPYWADMEFYNKIYKLGLFDVEAFTMTGDEFDAKVEKKQYMGIYEASKSQSNYLVVPSSGMTVYTNVILPTGNAPGNYTFVSANTEKLDAVLSYINYLYDPDFSRLLYSGVEGTDWTYDENGVPSLTEQSIADRAAGTDYWSSTGNGYGYRWWYTNPYNPGVSHTDGYPLDLSYTVDALTEVQNDRMKDFCEVYGVDFWYDAFINAGAVDFSHDISEPLGGSITDVPAEIKRTVETCNDILYTAMPSLIMAETDEEFAQIREETLAELAAANENDAWEWYSEAWNSYLGMFTDYLNTQLEVLGLE